METRVISGDFFLMAGGIPRGAEKSGNVHTVLRLAKILLLLIISGPLLCTSLRAEPLIPMGAGKTALTAEKRLATSQDASQSGDEMVYSLLHGVNNAATIGISVRSATVQDRTWQSTSFSLIYDIGSRRYYNGVSSFYGKKFHGRKTASGETFTMNGHSAAHKSLPLGTMLKVTNPDTGKSVVVKVNDRGPYEKGRSLDLSQGAAKKIGLDKKGIGEVEIETLGLVNLSLLGGARQSQFTDREKSSSSASLYYGLTADFRLDGAIKAYAYGARDSSTAVIEYEAGLLLDLPWAIKAGASYGKHFDQCEGPGFFLQCRF